MWPFTRRPTRESLQGYKEVTVNGQRFTIRRLSPLLDFPADSMPQLFTDTTRNRPDPNNPATQKRLIQAMYDVLLAGVVEPKLCPVGVGDRRGKEPGLTPEDIFRDPETGNKLYFAIMEHSLFRLRMWQVPFFLAVKALLRFTVWRRSMAERLTRLRSAGASA